MPSTRLFQLGLNGAKLIQINNSALDVSDML
jgi:hypothetical protein